GVRIPTLADVLEELSPSSTGAFLEIKQPHLYGGVDGIGIEVVRSIRRNTPWLSAGGPRDRLVVQAFNDGFLRSFARRHDNIVVGTLGPANRLAAYAAWADQVNVHHRDVTRDLVRSAHAAGLAVSTYVVNRRRRMDVVVSRGVDAISTDRPARLHGVLRRRSRVMEDPNAPKPPARASNAALTVRAPRRALLQTRVPLTARVRGSDGSRARWTWVKVQLKTPNRWRTLQRRVTDRRGNLRTTVTARQRLRLRVRSSATPWHTADGIRRSIDTEKADTRVRLYGDGRVRAGSSTRLRVRWRAEDGRRVSGRARLWARSGGGRWQPIRRLSVRRGARAVRVRVGRRDTRFQIRARRGAWWTGDRDRHFIRSIGR
ncbi:MAG: glycerophosphodiester phosphodiesterase, partial [Nocardioidaceae bacterium]